MARSGDVPSVRRLASALKRSLKAFRGGSTGAEPHRFPIYLDYPVHPRPRYGYEKPAHPHLAEIISRRRDEYRSVLKGFLAYADELLRIPLDATGPTSPYWHNSFLTGLDAVALYGMLATKNPTRYVEVGSGHSTRFARAAINDQRLKTTITSIDPEPRAEIDALCDTVLRVPLEDADLAIFDELQPGDIVFFDGSHRSFANSDVTVAFLDVLPRLRPGVIVEIHDITLPWDYPQVFCDAYYSEQYLLAAYLLAGGGLEILLPNFYVTLEPELRHIMDPIWDRVAWAATPTNGLSFWVEKT